jgi:dihydrofolate synthase/folylpolyglutamate synthase
MDAIERIHQFDRFGMILGLERMNMLLDRLGHPEKDLKVIHVAGTNGKGSGTAEAGGLSSAAGHVYECPAL